VVAGERLIEGAHELRGPPGLSVPMTRRGFRLHEALAHSRVAFLFSPQEPGFDTTSNSTFDPRPASVVVISLRTLSAVPTGTATW